MVYKILIAEDEVTMRRLMATLLKRHNHEIIEAGDGEAAFALAHEHQPDIILLDVMMPIADGFETVRRLRANPDTESIPVIFLSAKGQVEDRVEGLRLGGDDYIIKPAEPAELLARIDSVILRSRREARRRKGQVFGFMGAKGGVGKTTAIANLAVHFNNNGRTPFLIDMNLVFGNLAEQFGLSGVDSSLAHLTTLPHEEIDVAAVQNAALRHSSGISILASPPIVPSWATFSTDHLRVIVEQAAFAERFVFLDLPRDPDVLEVVAEQISGLILVLTSEPAGLRTGQAVAAYLNNAGMHDRISAILIHRAPNEHQYVDASKVAEYLGCLVLGAIPYKPDVYLRAEYDQVPLLLKSSGNSDATIFDKIGTRLLNYVDTLEQFQKQQSFQSRRLT
ncbi:response regulator [bacterium]|nr:response regulator [bacterium]